MNKPQYYLELKHSSYSLNPDWIESLRRWGGLIIVIGGVSGVGKTTISEKLGYPMPVSFTSRERKKSKESYHFVSKEEFECMEENNSFATITRYSGGSFGLPVKAWDELAKKHRVILLGMNPRSYRLLKEAYPRTIGVFITAPYETVMNRLMERDGYLDDVRVASYENNHRSQDYYHISYSNVKSVFKAVMTIRMKIMMIQALLRFKGDNALEKYFPTQKSPIRKPKRNRSHSEKFEKYSSPSKTL